MPQFLPPETPTGGSQVGNSYVTLFENCPRKWFNSFYRPLLNESHELVARGLQPINTDVNLLGGRILHEGMAALYLSGCQDGEDTGEWDIDHAIDVLNMHADRAAPEYLDEDLAESNRNMCQVLLRTYYDEYGPDSAGRDYPIIRVAHDQHGKPLVEMDFKVQLSNEYIYTCRSDTIIYHNGYLKTLEHKTSHPMFVKQKLGSVKWDAQISGEYYVMQQHFPEDALAGVMYNVLPKNRSANSKFGVAERETGTRTPAQLERWRLTTLDTLRRIDEAVERFEELMKLGTASVEQAADYCFPLHGTRTSTCFAFNRDCEFSTLCQMPGLEKNILRSFRGRTQEETDKLRELNY